MSKNFNLNIHQVTSIRVGPVKENSPIDGFISTNRELVIETPDGTIEITLFSQYVSEDSDGNPLEVRL
jgi:hypothetical protein